MRTFYLLRVLATVVMGVLVGQESATAQLRKDKPGKEISLADVGQRRLSEESKLDPEVQALIDKDGAVPPEFAADVLLRLAESDRISQQSVKLRLITNAFYLAESAQQPIKKRPGIPLAADSRSGYLQTPFD